MTYRFLDDGRVLLPRTADPTDVVVPGWHRYWAGLDLGRNDPSALCIIEDRCYPERTPRGQALGPRACTVVWLDIVQDTDYSDIAYHVARVLGRLGRPWQLAVDASGLGGPFCSTLDQMQIPHWAVTMTGGANMQRKGNKITVAKNLLLETMAVGFETADLTIAHDLPLKDRLVREIESFELATTAAGNLVLEGGGKGHHADAAISTALAWLLCSKIEGGGLVGSFPLSSSGGDRLKGWV